MTTYDVALVTYVDFPNLVSDDVVLCDAVRRLGLTVRPAVWDDPNVDWSAAALTVCRSMWDYFHKVPKFREWIGRTKGLTTLVNPAHIIEWNMDKKYLLDLRARGVEIVPTSFLTGGCAVDLRSACSERGWNDVVVKPTIAGSAFGARRFQKNALEVHGQAHVDMLLRGRDVMVQPYMATVETERERAFIFIDGEFSHGLLKAPFSAGAAAGETREEPIDPSREEIAFAQRVTEAVGEPLAYARVDFVPTDNGPKLMELELIEPNLFFRFSSEGAQRLANALFARLSAARSIA